MQREKLAHKIRFLVFWTTALLFEIPFIISLIQNSSTPLHKNPFSILAIHVMAAITLFFSFGKGDDWFDVKNRWPKLFFFLTLFLPVFGILICFVLYFFGHPRHDPKKIFEDDEIFFSNTNIWNIPGKSAQFSRQITESMDFIPLSDILSGHDIELKRGAIEKLALLATPEAITLLLKQRSDATSEVRFFATSALTRIKKTFDDKLEAAKLEMQKNIYKISARVFLAKVYLQYAQSHLLDEPTTQAYLKEAEFNLLFATESEHILPEAYQILLDLYTKNNNWDNALKLVLKMKELNLASDQDVTKIQIKQSFSARDYTGLARHLDTLLKGPQIEPEWLAMSHWWGGTKS